MNDLEALLDRFEEAWHAAAPPSLHQFLSAHVPRDQAARRELLIELVKIDMQRRWSRPQPGSGKQSIPGDLPERPLLQDYLKCHGELGTLEELPLELIGEEYRARRYWGDRPAHADYLARFGARGGALKETLQRVDASVGAELGRDGRGEVAAARSSPIGVQEAIPPVGTVASLIDTLRKHDLLPGAELKKLEDLAEPGQAKQLRPSLAEPRVLAKHLLDRNLLTPYQINQLLLGRGAELVLGPYLLLERLGEGGAGQVFKARHRKMDRIVALKLIRRELLADAEVVARFYREIQIVSQLDHPNVVHAYDAGPFGATHFLAMEFVEGADLGKLVKAGGPLPVLQACAYIRQAALGLQHAHQHGLVHRDIKPHNLIVSRREALVKVADLGLARLPRTGTSEMTVALSGTGTLTPENAVLMGTTDYLAPEQALDFHRVDIRADIYSLGCTFYFLLAGQPPFPGKTLAEKLLKHQQAEPAELEQFRSDLPAGVARVMRRLLAKRPEDRFQTPAEVAAALEALLVTATAGRLPRSKRRLALLAGIGALLLLGPIALLGFPPFSRAPDSGSSKASVPELANSKATWRHQKPVLTVAFGPDGQLVASSGDDKIIRLWDVSKAQERAPFVGHANDEGPVTHLVFVERGTQLVSVSKAGRAPRWRWWDVRSGQDQKVEFPGSWTAARSVHVGTSPVVALEQEDGTLLLGALGTRGLLGPAKDVGGLKCLAFGEAAESFAIQDKDGRISLWHYKGGWAPTLVRTLAGGPSERTHALALSPDGKTLASAGHGQSIKLWDTNTGKERALSTGHRGAILAVALSADGQLLATGSADATTKLWEVASAKLLATLAGHSGPINSVRFSPDGKHLATGSDDQTVRLWDLSKIR